MKTKNNLFLEVKDSPIHGKGIFAAKDFSENETICEFGGEIIDEAECIKRENENNVYIFWYDGNNYIDVQNDEIIKYLNHSCSPNCRIEQGEKEFTLKIVACKKIRKGDEITIDYGYPEIYENCSCEYCQKFQAAK